MKAFSLLGIVRSDTQDEMRILKLCWKSVWDQSYRRAANVVFPGVSKKMSNVNLSNRDKSALVYTVRGIVRCGYLAARPKATRKGWQSLSRADG